MELESSTTTVPSKKYQIPPDVNTGDNLFSQQLRYPRLAIPAPVIYGIHLATILIFGVLSLVFGILSDGLKKPSPFWEVFPEFLAASVGLTIVVLVQFALLPAFWRDRARQMIDEGLFDSRTTVNGGRRLVLEVGCNEGATSEIFARTIIDRQRDVGNLAAPYATLPIFIGYDKWNPWSRIPNTPACFLSTLLHAGVPRDHIIANRVDTTSKESKARLPYPSGSISLILCNRGLAELTVDREDRTILFRELVRVLEPDGRIVLVENDGVGKWKTSGLWKGPHSSYKQVLVDEMGWGPENVVIKWGRGIHYLVAVKPSGTSKPV